MKISVSRLSSLYIGWMTVVGMILPWAGNIASAGICANADAFPGWENRNPARKMPLPAKELWRAPFRQGKSAFNVDWRDGAKGRVAFEDGAIRVEKANDIGMVVVSTKFKSSPGQLLQSYAACYSEAPVDPFYGKAFIRMWSGREDLKWHRKHFGRSATESPLYEDIINTYPGQFTRKLCRAQAGDSGEVTAAIVVKGPPSVTVWREWGVEDAVAADAKWKKDARKLAPPDRSATMIDEAAFDAALAKDTEHYAEMVKTADGGVLNVDGRKMPSIFYKPIPFGMGVPFTGEGGIFEKSGIDIQVVNIRFGVGHGRIGFWTKDGFDCAAAVKRVKDFMRSAPNSLFLVTIRCDAYPEYADEHPGEAWITEDGSPVWGGCSSGRKMTGTPLPNTWPWISNHSLVWRNDVKRLMTQFVGELKRTGLAKRIIGAHLAGYHDGQFAVPVADFSPAAARAFLDWQKAQYGEVKWSKVPAFPKDTEFLNPNTEQAHIAYQRFLKNGPMLMQDDLAAHLKKEFGKPIVVGRWCMNPFGGSIMATIDFGTFTKSRSVDFLVAQPRYQRRAPGLECAVRVPLASFRLHGKMFLNEFDLRTWHGRGGENEARTTYLSRAEDLPMWKTVHRRLAGQMFANRMGWWYFDMCDNWFDDPGIQADIALVRKTASKLMAKDDSSPEPVSTAVVVDEDGLLLCNRAGIKGFSRREHENTPEQLMLLGAAGVPYDVLLANDLLENPSRASRYKAFLMVGFYEMDEVRRQFAEQQRKRGAKLFFFSDAGICGGADAIAPDELQKVRGSFTPRAFNDFARSAGAYVPSPAGLQVDMNGGFMSIHCLKTGRYDFELPFKADVTNLKTGNRFKSISVLSLDVTGGETRWYSLAKSEKGCER